LIALASEKGLDLLNYGEVRKEELMTPVLMDRKRQETQIEIDKHRQTKEIDQEYLVKEINAKVEGALKYQLLSMEQSILILARLELLRDRLHQVRYSGQPIDLVLEKQKDYLLVIQGMEALLGRLLQADNGKNAGGGDQDTIIRGLTEPDNPEGEEPQIPAP
jgi:hypothetical protein